MGEVFETISRESKPLIDSLYVYPDKATTDTAKGYSDINSVHKRRNPNTDKGTDIPN